ncbi:MAG: hypothetical protein LBM06_09505 [Prevotellaceae bacterium]|jgi:hypothetical protein|nr:hypothetical protein [Prevotellaceae bacterium]
MNKKTSYQTPSIHILKMDSEGVIAASTQDFGAGKRYDLGQHTPRPLTGGLFRFAKNLLPLMAAALMLPACSSGDEPQLNPDEKVLVTFTASKPSADDATTRTVYGVVEGTTDDIITVDWNSDATTETLGMVALKEGNMIVGASSVQGTSFTGTSLNLAGYAAAGADAYTFYYPYKNDYTGAWVISSINAGAPLQSISFNQSDQVSIANELSNLSDYDVMYIDEPVTDGSTFVLKHACAALYFNLTLPNNAPAIDNITLSASEPVFKTYVTINYGSDGKVTSVIPDGDALSTLTLKITGDVAGTGDGTGTRSLKAYMTVPPQADPGDFYGKLIKVSANTAGNAQTYSKIINLYDTSIASSTDKLESGKCYSFYSILTEDKFAGSNIYWDDVNKELTFVKEPYDMSKVMYQGLFFRWGGLQGISPAGNWNSSTAAGTGTPVYSLSSTTPSYGGAFSNSIAPAGPWASGQNLTNDRDICYQIDNNFRLPASSEFTISNYVNGTTTDTAAPAGTAQVKTGYIGRNAYIPSSGYRSYANGDIYLFNEYFCYWTSTVSTGSSAFCIEDGGESTANINSLNSIRCVKK